MQVLHKILNLCGALDEAEVAALVDLLSRRLHDLRGPRLGNGQGGPKPIEPLAAEAPALTFQLEYVKCGKAGCHCEVDSGHGPYWYAYWSRGGRTRKKYLGKRSPWAGLGPREGK